MNTMPQEGAPLGPSSTAELLNHNKGYAGNKYQKCEPSATVRQPIVKL